MSATELTPLLEEIMRAAEKLPPFPQVVSKVMPLIQQMAPVNEIEAVVQLDPVITSRVLTLSQSPLYSRGAHVESLREAIITIGNRQLIQVILAACARDYFHSHAGGYDLQEGELWQHAVGTALLADKIATQINNPHRFVAYTAGLLHDIGKTILSFFVEDYFQSIFALVNEKNLRFLDAEREVLGIDHQELGALIAQRWNFPAPVRNAIRYHHFPSKAKEHQDIAAIVYAANRIVSSVGIGCGVDGFLQPNGDQVFAELKISAKMIDHFMADVVIALDEAQLFLHS